MHSGVAFARHLGSSPKRGVNANQSRREPRVDRADTILATRGGVRGSRTPKAFAAVLQTAATRLYSNRSLKRPLHNGLKTVCRATYSRWRTSAYALALRPSLSLCRGRQSPMKAITPITTRTSDVIVLAFLSSHSPCIWYPTAVATNVSPTNVIIVTKANTPSTRPTVPAP